MESDEAMDSVMTWEWNEIKQWKRIATEGYGWTENDPRYTAQLKLIRSQALLKQKALLGRKSRVDTTRSGEVQDEEDKREKPKGWYDKPDWTSRAPKCTSFKEARAKMLMDAPYGAWVTDRDAPSGKDWRRFISIHEDNPMQFFRVRIMEG